MTSETYLDLTFDRTAKSGKRPIRPKLLKLTDVTIPHRNRKKTKVKTKDRSVSSVRDRIYDDPAYTDDISHLANPLRRSSCSGKGDAKAAFASISVGGSSSLGKRSKLTKEFLQYAKQGGSKSSSRGLMSSLSGVTGGGGVVSGGGSYEHGSGGDISSSSEDGGPLRSDATKSGSSMGRRGRSLERSIAVQNEKPIKRDKRDRSSKQKRNLSLDNKQQSQEAAVKRVLELEVLNLERGLREKDHSKSSQQQSLLKQYSDGVANDAAWSEAASRFPPDHDELFSVRSSSKDSALNSAATKMQIGRRFLKGEIGIKSFNYYLLKEGLKSSKKFVEKQRDSLTSGLSGSSKKLHSRSEENIYEEIFFKDALPSDEENQNQAIGQQQQQHVPPQHGLIQAGTPVSQCSEDAIYPDCELCMQQCTKENCEYCSAATVAAQLTEMHGGGSQRGVGVRQYSNGGDIAMPQQHHNQQQYDIIGRAHTRAAALINQVQATTTAVTTITNQQQQQRNGNNNGSSSMPTAHILEFQSYNPNNPGVYKIETTPVAITGEYNPILQFQQSSPSTTTATTPSEHHQQHHQHQKQYHQYQQQKQQKPLPSQGYLVQSSIPLAAAMTNHYHQGGAGVGGAGIMPMQKHHQRGTAGGSHRGLGAPANGQQHFILSYNGAANVTTSTTTAATMQRMNTKSSSSSDSLQQQQLNKFNTMARLEANAMLADPFYGGDGVGHMHPLMYAASRPIGGSQILVDPYDVPQMYKSESKASILSEYSLRSSNNSHHRYNRYRYGGRGEVSDSSLGDSLFSYNSAQRRYFGSSESCRFAFECRRCSLDGGEKCSYSDTCRYECRNCDCSSSYFSSDFDDIYGSIAGGTGGMHRSSGIPRKTAAGTLPSCSAPPPAAEFERQQEQLDLKQNKYAQDFFKHVNDVKRSIYQSEMQRNSSNMDAPNTSALDDDKEQLGRTSKSPYDAAAGSPHRLTTAKLQPTTVSTLPLTKERTRTAQQSIIRGGEARSTLTDSSLTPTPAPRTSLQQIAANNAMPITLPTHPPQPSQRRREYPSLDRLVATATGAIPKQNSVPNSQITHNNNNNISSNKPQLSTKNNATNTAGNVTAPPGATTSNNNRDTNKQSPHQSPKTMRITDRPLGMKAEADEQLAAASVKVIATATTRARSTAQITTVDETMTKRERERDRFLNVGSNEHQALTASKRHHRSTSSKTPSSLSSTSTRRKDTPAPPPPSPATYSDLQELKANLESAKDDTKPQSSRVKKHNDEITAAQARTNEQVTAGGMSIAPSQKQQNILYIKQQIAKDEKSKHSCNNNVSKAIVMATAAVAATSIDKTIETATKDEQQNVENAMKVAAETAAASQHCVNVVVGDGEHTNIVRKQQKQQATANNANHNNNSKNEIPTAAAGVTVSLEVDKLEVNSTTTMSPTTATAAVSSTSTCATNIDANDDDDVFYDARSEDSGGGGGGICATKTTTTAASAVSSSSSALKQVAERHHRPKDGGYEEDKQQYQHLLQQQLQSQKIANNNKNIRMEEKLNVTKDSVDSVSCSGEMKLTDTHKDNGCGEGGGDENENKKSKKEISNEAYNNSKKVDVKKVTNDMQSASTTVAAAMALNLDEVVVQTPIPLATKVPASSISTTADPKDTRNNNNDADAAATITTKKEPATTALQKNNNNEYAKSKKHERRSSKQHQQQQEESSRQRKPIATTTTTTTTITTVIPTISCDTCCQLEECADTVSVSAVAVAVNVKQQQQQQKQTSINEMARAGKIKTSNTSSKERASKIKQEIKLKHEIKTTIASTTTTTLTTPTTCAEMQTTIAAATASKCDTQVPTATPTTVAVETLSDIGAQNDNISTNSKKRGEEVNVSKQNVAAACLQEDDADGEKINQTSFATTCSNTITVISTIPAAEATSTTLNTIVASTASVANLAGSCNSDIAGVATLSNSISSYNTVPITITTTSQDLQATNNKRPQLYRQDYSCLDSSEAQSDDSHLTRDSITRESQNDELSSSTHDKLDLSTLPLPALPPKKRRTRLRASPSRHHSSRRHESDLLPSVVSGGGSDDPSNSHSHHNQSALLLPHVNVSEVAPHLSAFQQYVAKRRESLEASTRSFNEKLEARRMHYHMGGGGGASGAAAGTTGVGGAAANGTYMKPTYLFGEHQYGMPHVQSRKTLTPASKEEIFLNKSGWVQVNTKRGIDENRGYRRVNYAHQNGGVLGAADMRNTIRVIQIDNTRRSDMAHQALLHHQYSIADASGAYGGNGGAAKFSGSKVEELIQRNEDRLNSGGGVSSIAVARDPTLRPGYRIVDPQLASILNERPGFLPVKNLNDADSPPPITPILSPPPAFQDSSKSKHFDRRKAAISSHQQKVLPTTTVTNLHSSNSGGSGGGSKGMVFSRSFEYDARRPTPADTYVETFSRSFDGNLSERPPPPLQRERSPNFSSLTGNSPNYLSKKDSGGGSSGSLRSRDNSPKYQQPQTTAYLNTSVKEAPPAYSIASSSKHSPRARHERSFERSKSQNLLGRSRKSQFNRVGSSGPTAGGCVGQTALNVGMSRFRSFDTSMSQRLNSCDSGARSDLSNDELDNDDDEGPTEFLTTNYHHTISPLKTQRQRSLTPDRNESQSSSSSMRKQRSLTPESRSLTPEDRRKKGSQVSLMGTRQNSSSRSNTLERKQRHDEKQSANISRSSSSSSYSGRENEQHVHTGIGSGAGGGCGGNRAQHRRSLGRNAKQTDEHRIRRSRSLQLSERSPNRSHKIIVSVGQSHIVPNQQPPVYQQANYRSNNGGGGHNNFPSTIRTTAGKSQPILMNMNPHNGGGGRVRSTDIDKSRSFDFDYCNYNNSGGATGATPKSHNSGTSSSSNQNVPMRLDFDKSRSFDDDYREPVNSSSNNNLGANAMRYLQTNEGSGGGSSSGTGSRLRRSSPVGIGGSGGGGHECTSRSPQSSGSSCNNLNIPRQSTSPQQNYGTRLCDHELTYDMLRKSLDRSPIMDFRRGDSGDYDLPQSVIRNRETINSGGNSELNFLSSDARVYDLTSKQQRHVQSPSDSPYSLERLHNSSRGESITPDGGGASVSDYRTEYAVYRQGNAHGSSQQHHRGETRSNNRSSHQNTTTKMKAVKSPVSCSFWPHCGACNNNSILQQKPLTSTSSNRQNSLKSPRAQAKFNNDYMCDVTTSGKNERASLLRRYHSENLNDKHLATRNGNGGNGKINGKNAAANVSTVNVNIIKLDNGGRNANAGNVDKSCQRNKSQWTLLCSGVKPTVTVPEISPRIASHMCRSDNLTVVSDANKLPTNPYFTLSTATSLVFLGNCEMPITRDHNARQRLQNAISADAGNGRGRTYVARHSSTERANDDCSSGNCTKQKTTTANNFFNSNKRKISATTKRKDETTIAKIYDYLGKERSLSLPNIFVQLPSTTTGLPKITTANDGVNIIGIKNGFSGNLSHQIRAVSSPSLTDALQQETDNDNAATTTIQLTSATSSVSDESITPPARCNGAGVGSSNNYTNIPTSQSVGVLQKFKRTLTSFNKNHQQYAPNAASNNGNNSHMYAHGSNGASSTSTLSVAAATAAAEMPQHHDITDSASGKYRFGPLIWRSSKERRKTKYNRRDKCNSGDSGIQIELENDEQFTRVSVGGGANTLPSTGMTVARNADDKVSPKLRSVRRTNSAKATTIFDQTTAAMSAKAKILKRMENFSEREAPESLPTRSLSQPNGLETFGIGRTGDLDDSDDSDSVASHDEGPNYYTMYAEVLYNFTAAGPQELGLERGTLIEILRKEVGPWWFGRIKKEDTTLVEEILDPELGWFPKEFVRVIQCPEMDTFFLSHMSQSNTLIPTTVLSLEQTFSSSVVASPPTTIPPSLSSSAVAAAAATTTAVANTILPAIAINADSDADADADATMVDQNNVTTIVIESPTTYNNLTGNANSSSSDCVLVPSRSTNIIMDSADVLRRSAVKELLDTEMNYVKLLASICEGYLPAMSKRIDIFSPNSIRLIFSNILAIYKFQRKFLEALRKGIEQNQIAKIFLKMHKGFLCYSTYCNAYPRALIELESYDRVKDAKTILDNCRESENLAELPLSAHLLAPVQRICRYPLHLAEIIKNAAKSVESSANTLPPPSPTQDLQQLEQMDVSQLDIPDTRGTIDMALEAMKSITEAVNEGKRHSETIARHQSSFQNFKGPPLHLHSTRFFLQIDATRQKQNLWNSSCTLFLFDNQLIYCKRDIIKRSQFIYKGRVFLDRCRVVNVRDGKMFGHTIKNSLRIYCEARDKWFDFSFRSANRKHRFLNTLALERQFGGKALYVSEMAGFEYAFEERDFSDQSDYEMPDSETGVGGASGLSSLRLREHIYDITAANNNGSPLAVTSGESSVPESPVKYKSNADTLPKKSQSRDAISGNGIGNGGTNIAVASECQTGSLGRRRLGNWFRKPKSSNSTPNDSPTHKPLELQMMPTKTSLPNLTLVERAQDATSGSTS